MPIFPYMTYFGGLQGENTDFTKLWIKKFAQHLPGCMKLILGLGYLYLMIKQNLPPPKFLGQADNLGLAARLLGHLTVLDRGERLTLWNKYKSLFLDGTVVKQKMVAWNKYKSLFLDDTVVKQKMVAWPYNACHWKSITWTCRHTHSLTHTYTHTHRHTHPHTHTHTPTHKQTDTHTHTLRNWWNTEKNVCWSYLLPPQFICSAVGMWRGDW